MKLSKRVKNESTWEFFQTKKISFQASHYGRNKLSVVMWLIFKKKNQRNNRDIWRDSREVRCVVHTPMIESSIPCLREAFCVRMSSYLTIASG